ncbi:AFG1-like ATPase-domain-containing protein, partial [Blyttiomyces helicus]
LPRLAGPLGEYFRLVTEKKLKPDEDQMRLVVKLQRLTEDLLDYTPPVATPSLPSLVRRQRGWPGASPTGPRPYVRPRGIWIHGEVGTGKTLAMDLFYTAIPVERKKRVHFHAFMVSAFAKIHDWQYVLTWTDSSFYLVARDLVQDAWLICLDEFQVPDVATATVVRQLLSSMFELGAVLVATSNRKPDDLYKGGFNRDRHGGFIDLIKDRCDEFHIRSKVDYREEMVKAQVPSMVALFTFEELCGSDGMVGRLSFLAISRLIYCPGDFSTKPLGPADHLTICRKYHTIVVQSVPRMGLAQKNEARRFITFVDAAYENKVKLIISADADPTSLFITTEDPITNPDDSSDAFMHREMMGDLLGTTGRGRLATTAKETQLMMLAILTGEEEKFAFRRAVSRLCEMRGAEWAIT